MFINLVTTERNWFLVLVKAVAEDDSGFRFALNKLRFVCLTGGQGSASGHKQPHIKRPVRCPKCLSWGFSECFLWPWLKLRVWQRAFCLTERLLNKALKHSRASQDCCSCFRPYSQSNFLSLLSFSSLRQELLWPTDTFTFSDTFLDKIKIVKKYVHIIVLLYKFEFNANEWKCL